MPGNPPGLTWNLIQEARERIAGKVGLTPVLTSATLDAQTGAQLHFKCENFQKCGAFKARGATNAVFALPESQARRGVVTHSSGNHAAALARAARLRGDRKSTRLNSSHSQISYAVFCLKKKTTKCYTCAFYHYQMHTRPRVQRASGIPHALFGQSLKATPRPLRDARANA